MEGVRVVLDRFHGIRDAHLLCVASGIPRLGKAQCGRRFGEAKGVGQTHGGCCRGGEGLRKALRGNLCNIDEGICGAHNTAGGVHGFRKTPGNSGVTGVGMAHSASFLLVGTSLFREDHASPIGVVGEEASGNSQMHQMLHLAEGQAEQMPCAPMQLCSCLGDAALQPRAPARCGGEEPAEIGPNRRRERVLRRDGLTIHPALEPSRRTAEQDLCGRLVDRRQKNVSRLIPGAQRKHGAKFRW
mmetsp:Transcript_14341/g.39600  ORF Transcript_14341/g.39600 Transcript_14341/m.39600 type:complete len:243 (+) Transcript_14341:903-1631(+)